MADLGEVRPGQDRKRLLLLGGALGVLLAGLVVLSAGAARLGTRVLVEFGIPAVAARQIAIAAASTVPPILLAGTLLTSQEHPRVRLVGLVGVAIALTGVAAGLPLNFQTGVWITGGVYGIGLLLVLASVLHGLVVGDDGSATGRTTGWTRDSSATGSVRAPGSGPMPADGGEEDGELSFLLEDERERE